MQALHSAYMPFLINGGLFLSVSTRYQIGSEVFLILKLMDNSEKIALSGKVVWVTPPRAQGVRKAGFGIQFANRGSLAKTRIENLLKGQSDQEQATQTL